MWMHMLKKKKEVLSEDIAIIGMSGRFPGASSIPEFFENLKEGKESITFFRDEELREAGVEESFIQAAHYIKAAPVLDDIDKFDASFFNIPPVEAKVLDPQQRLLLECAWATFEDAGYVPEKLVPMVGVFSGSGGAVSNYLLECLRYDSTIRGATGGIEHLGNDKDFVSTRVSYKLNIKGPSINVQTACSTSLVAVHLACQSILHQECDMALAGGVNIRIPHRVGYALKKDSIFSHDGHVRAFDADAQGIVFGSGLGLVLLKPLEQAMRDHDQIYAVIKGSAFNNDGGQKMSYMATTATGQVRCMRKAFEKAKVSPKTVNYVEAHGTGTAMGDPVEVTALTRMFDSPATHKGDYCALGSVKNNIGHLDIAAGVASLIKTAMCLKHKTLVPCINYKTANPKIDFNETPFYVNTKLKPWTVKDQSPRRACINSLGIGGTNSFLILEEAPEQGRREGKEKAPCYLIPLSAKTEGSLNQKINDLSDWFEAVGEQPSIRDIAYTLQVGRKHFKYRFACVVKDAQDLRNKILRILTGKTCRDSVMYSSRSSKASTETKEKCDQILAKLENKRTKDESNYHKDLFTLAEAFVQGYKVNWSNLANPKISYRVSLPTYPFERERYWVERTEGRRQKSEAYQVCQANGMAEDMVSKRLHPFVHENTSTLEEQRFSSMFTGKEFFLEDHQVKGEKVLPGVAYLEMARAAVEQASGEFPKENQIIELKNVVWAWPFAVDDQPQDVHIGLYPEDNGEIAYEIYTAPPVDGKFELRDSKHEKSSKDEIVVHSQGVAVFASADQHPKLDLKALQETCTQRVLSAEECYTVFKKIGIEYGPAHQGIEKLYVGDDEVLAQLKIPSCVLETKDQFTLHPSLLDSALQAAIGSGFTNQKSASADLFTKGLAEEKAMEDNPTTKPVLRSSLSKEGNQEPFLASLNRLEIIDYCSEKMWAHVHRSGSSGTTARVQKLDIDLCDENGKVCVKLRDFFSQTPEGVLEKSETTGTLMFQPVWRERAVDPKQNIPEYADHQVFLCGLTQRNESVGHRASERSFIELKPDQKRLGKRFEEFALDLFKRTQKIVEGKPEGPVLLQVLVPAEGFEQTFSGVSGLLKTAHLENPKLMGQVIAVGEEEPPKEIISRLQENVKCPEDQCIRYEGTKRLVQVFEERSTAHAQKEIPWKEGGVYLITGGAGGLGLIFAKEIAERTKSARLILTGRSELSEPIKEKLKELESLGANVEYHTVDVSDQQAVERLIEETRNDFGGINGILHSAGLIRDNFILKKPREEFEETLKPKVEGVIYLDEATQDLSLDFFVLFSSVSGAIGNVGQADYATANAFMDTFARYRNVRIDSERSGQTLSMNWPLWKEGGMSVDEATEQMITERTGMVAMQTSTGIEAFYQGLSSGTSQVMVMEGDVEKIRNVFLADQTVVPVKESPVPAMDPHLLQEKTLYEFKKLFGEMIKLSISKIDSEEPLERYGIDSILITQLNQKLEGVFGEISKTLFFEYQTLKALTDYFIADYPQACAQWAGLQEQAYLLPNRSVLSIAEEFPVLRALKSTQGCGRGLSVSMSRTGTQDPMAIIGMSGRYPQANTIEEYWEHLKSGKDCITEIPPERWSLNGFFHEDPQEAVAQGKSYSKWGSFLEGFADFDPLFFNISPREAMNIDPQERLFLQSCWEALEDAGCTREHLATQFNQRVGVFAGITKTGFNLYGPELKKQRGGISPHTSFSSVANRVSYLLNIQGPSMPIDTMCSSSLTAIHEACEHLRHGACELAIAGGVNLYLHPSTYIELCAQQMLSKDGQCKSFGKGGNGFVPGEGVGVVLLKRLSKAIEDQDHIYAVIRATSVNHGGKTNGYTVPSPKAQGALIRETLEKAGIDARSVSYMEAHGTGTELGDPIEVTGLTQAFQKDTLDTGFCALGSAKSNVGHLEAAAGIAGLTKIVLQMKYGQLAPSLHAMELNPNIHFSKTPFIVQQQLEDWKRPTLTIKGETKEYPRIAGVSSFGAGGVNAHAVIEEYLDESKVEGPKSQSKEGPYLIVLSAKDEDRLKAYVQHLIDYLQPLTPCLQDVAYTLQVGREAMEERLGLIVHSMEELKEKLQRFMDGKEDVEDLYLGQVKRNKETLDVFTADEDMAKIIDMWVRKGKYSKLLDLWVKGLILDWNKLYGDTPLRRISLPSYPFARVRYWIKGNAESGVRNAETGKELHPLLHENTSDVSELRFSSTFTGKEFFFADHQVRGEKVLPGAAYLEMAREAVKQACGEWAKDPQRIELKNVVWAMPIAVNGHPRQVNIGLFPEENGEIQYEIYSELEKDNGSVTTVPQQQLRDGMDTRVVHSQGVVEVCGVETSEGAPTAEPIDVQGLQETCTQRVLSADECYAAFKRMGIEYGPAHKGIEKLYVGENKVLAKLTLPSSIADTKDPFTLHPSLLDSALQASIGLNFANQQSSSADLFTDFSSAARCAKGEAMEDKPITKPVFRSSLSEGGDQEPFLASLERLEILDRCTESMWAWVQSCQGSPSSKQALKLDIDLCDDLGHVCVRMKAMEMQTYLEPFTEDSTQEQEARAGNQTDKEVQGKNELSNVDARSYALNKLTSIVTEITQIPKEKINVEADLEELGLDSIMITTLNQQVEKWLGKLDATLFFKYKTLSSLAKFLSEAYAADMMIAEQPRKIGARSLNGKVKVQHSKDLTSFGHARFSARFSGKQVSNEDIAIIGMSGRYPQAPDLMAFWDNLSQGKDCITEIPRDRFDYRSYFNTEKGRTDSLYCKWGGFLDGVDQFDPLFFNISPQDARFMDPQERLFLEMAWGCLETAGFIHPHWQREARNIGVFAGVTFNNYQLLMAEAAGPGPSYPANSQTFSIANRVSYFFNFTGPSFTLDTACASSLFAIHEACENLKRGACSLALAGGVNLTLHPSKYATLCSGGFASSDGRCHAFAADGDGYVPSEGVGVVLLKPYQRAKADGDSILAVIKGTGVSHDGKTQSYTVPNPVSQSKAIGAALAQARISPESISYVEAHGTGTALGDPIEIQGLMDVYTQHTDKKQFCAIGSVKSNIGHGEAAAGIGQLTKTVLQMQHQTLVPSLLHGPLNPNIDFKNSSFYVQEKKTTWEQPRLEGKAWPRRAGISSFGAGGVNVHVIIEEYLDESKSQKGERSKGEPVDGRTMDGAVSSVVIPLSAHVRSQLLELARNLHGYLKSNIQRPVSSIQHLAFTLQTKRALFRHRLAFVVNDTPDLIEQLKGYVNQDRNGGRETKYYEADTEKVGAALKLNGVKEDQDYLASLLKKRKMERLAQLWVQGTLIPWERLYEDNGGSVCLPLPNYPFLKRRYWMTEIVEKNKAKKEEGGGQNGRLSNPLAGPIISVSDQAKEDTSFLKQANGVERVPPPSRSETSTFVAALLDLSDMDRKEEVEEWIVEQVKALLGFASTEDVDLETGFFNMGMESIQAEKLIQDCRRQFGLTTLSDTVLFDYPTAPRLTDHVLEIIPWEDLYQQTVPSQDRLMEPTEEIDTETEIALIELFDGDLFDVSVYRDIDALSDEDVKRDLLNELQGKRYD